MTETPCTHERETTEVLVDFRPDAYRSSGTRYEVYCCRDCGKLLNYMKSGEVAMTPDEIMQMFVDLHHHLVEGADEILSQAQDLYEKLDRDIIKKMPQVKR